MITIDFVNEKLRRQLDDLDYCKSCHSLEVCKAFKRLRVICEITNDLDELRLKYVGYQIKRMKGKKRHIWELRLNIKYRLIFTIGTNNRIMIIEALNDHQNLKGVK